MSGKTGHRYSSLSNSPACDTQLSSDFEERFEDSSSPPEVKRRRFISGVVVPCKRIDKSLYGVFLSGRVKQTMVTSERDGTFKGIKFEW